MEISDSKLALISEVGLLETLNLTETAAVHSSIDCCLSANYTHRTLITASWAHKAAKRHESHSLSKSIVLTAGWPREHRIAMSVLCR